MNRIYRLVWSRVRGAYVAAPETANGHGKAGASTGTTAGAAAITAGLCLLGMPGLVLAQSAVVAPGTGNTTVFS
ncbi:MAG TPA: ESPR domain-containing protein, partial [Candidatus Glassbacteria bacterium]|nr:ESPR domain-containing protein [Candidatus Glassbacteria bacterium]